MNHISFRATKRDNLWVGATAIKFGVARSDVLRAALRVAQDHPHQLRAEIKKEQDQ